MNIPLIGVGGVLILLAWGYLFQPRWILRLNGAARQWLFNDGHVLLRRRRTGAGLLVLGALTLLAGFLRLLG